MRHIRRSAAAVGAVLSMLLTVGTVVTSTTAGAATTSVGGIFDRTAASSVTARCLSDVVIHSWWNNGYVSAEVGYSGDDYGMLRARASEVGPWEKFTLCRDVDPVYGYYYYYLKSQANGLYVSAEVGYSGDDYGMLRARASEVGPWEKFLADFSCVGSYDGSVLGCRYTYLLSLANSKFVSAQFDYYGDDWAMLRAGADVRDRWANFILIEGYGS